MGDILGMNYHLKIRRINMYSLDNGSLTNEEVRALS